MTLSDDFLAHQGDELTALKERLTEELAYFREAAAPVTLDQAQVGRLSRIDAIGQQEMHKAAAVQTEQRLRRVLVAMRKLESGDYGDCDQCDEAIEPRRLEAQPEVSLCLRCQGASEGH
ncbi:TraR/DksA family transcriptional regulator [Saccharospirillum impatiens]|uniref:TraR/DksA family transcriptional regulator n=1 Tax=Saccharospirillum impatiens TaxID=169438 RepID=UPI0003FAB76D|nr:TraR/DksA C4-type zinc finger protein [Saccharospirillum impatiens]